MQRCEATIRLNGDLGNTVRKGGLSPAEIVILRSVHGGDENVIEIQPTGMDKTPHAQERARLAYIYGAEVVERVFPGQFAKLPVSLKDVEPQPMAGPEDEDEEEDEEEVTPANGTVERMEAMDPKPLDDGDDLNEDDKAIIAMIQEANNIGQLRAIATANEVEVTSIPTKLPDAKLHMIRSLFPMHKA
jgi:hypothetical protein